MQSVVCSWSWRLLRLTVETYPCQEISRIARYLQEPRTVVLQWIDRYVWSTRDTRKPSCSCLLAVHSKAFECLECGKFFSTRDTLAQHAPVHTRRAPFECPICDAEFKSERALRLHVERMGKEHKSNAYVLVTGLFLTVINASWKVFGLVWELLFVVGTVPCWKTISICMWKVTIHFGVNNPWSKDYLSANNLAYMDRKVNTMTMGTVFACSASVLHRKLGLRPCGRRVSHCYTAMWARYFKTDLYLSSLSSYFCLNIFLRVRVVGALQHNAFVTFVLWIFRYHVLLLHVNGCIAWVLSLFLESPMN